MSTVYVSVSMARCSSLSSMHQHCLLYMILYQQHMLYEGCNDSRNRIAIYWDKTTRTAVYDAVWLIFKLIYLLLLLKIKLQVGINVLLTLLVSVVVLNYFVIIFIQENQVNYYFRIECGSLGCSMPNSILSD